MLCNHKGVLPGVAAVCNELRASLWFCHCVCCALITELQKAYQEAACPFCATHAPGGGPHHSCCINNNIDAGINNNMDA